MRIKVFILGLLSILAMSLCAAPIRHYGYGSADWDAQRQEIYRLVGSVPIALNHESVAVMTEKAAFAAESGLALCATYSPWHLRLINEGGLSTDWGERALEDWRYMQGRFGSLRSVVDRVDAIILNTEFVHDDPAPDVTAQAFKYAIVDDFVRVMFPEAKILWYGRAPRTTPSATIEPSPWWSGVERTDYLTPRLYFPDRLGRCVLVLAEARRMAAQRGTPLAVFVSLGASYVSDWQPGSTWQWQSPYAYPTSCSWELGYLVGLYADSIDMVIFYPPIGKYDGWAEHWAAYKAGLDYAMRDE